MNHGMTDSPDTLVLGIGNLIMTDDGVGVKVIHLLQERYSFPGTVALLDGGTLGLDLLPHLEGVKRLVVVDAVETGGPPGTLVRLTGDEINYRLPHQALPPPDGSPGPPSRGRTSGVCP